MIKVNNVPLATTTTSRATVFGSLYCNQTSFNFDGEIHYLYILNQRISEAASDALFKHIRSRLSAIQGVAIGNQFWASSNYEGVIAGDGTVIPEVQSSANVELITNVADREFTSDTGFWSLGTGWSISAGALNYSGSVAAVFSKDGLLTIGKSKKTTYSINFESYFVSFSYCQ